MDRAPAVHGPAAHGAERRRRLAVPLLAPQHPVLRGGRRRHHVQDPLQRLRREHRRPADGRRETGARADADARAGGRADDGGPDQGSGRVSRRHPRRQRPRGGRRAAGRRPEGAGRDRGGHGADPRRPLRQRAAPPAEAGAGAGVEPVRRHQRGGLRGLRALRRAHELHVPPPGRDGARPEDPGPRVVLQSGPLVPRRRLPVVRDGRDRAGDRLPALVAARPRGRCRRGAGRARGARPPVSRLSARRRGHRGDHDERAARLGGAARRAARGELRPDRGRPEVGARPLQPDPLRAGGGPGCQQGGARPRRPLPRARPPGRRHARQPRPLRPGADGGGRERVGPAERRDGAQRRLRAARRGDPRPDRPPHARRRQRRRRRATAGRGPVRRLHDDQHAGARGGLPGRAPAARRRGRSRRPSA